MALAVSLLFDDETARHVRYIWRALAKAGLCRFMQDLDYAPHLSLVVTDDETAEDALRDAIGALKGSAPLAIDLGPARDFPETSIGWLAGGASTELRHLQRQIASSLPHEAIREHYRPEQWVPHVTVQMTGDVAAGLSLARAYWPEPKPATALRIELARFMPVEPIESVVLAY